MYVFEDPEPNGEVEQDLMMELDYRTLHVHVEMCVCVLCVCVVCVCVCLCVCVCVVCVCVCLGINVYLCVYLHAVIFCKLDHFHVCTCHLLHVYCSYFSYNLFFFNLIYYCPSGAEKI